MNTNEQLKAIFAKKPIAVFVGQSGSGKGTQVELFKDLHISIVTDGYPAMFKYFHEVTGNMFLDLDVYTSDSGALFRSEIPKMSPWIRSQLDAIQKSGNRQSHVAATILWGWKFLHEYDGGFAIFDGSPRSEGEAKDMIDFFKSFNKDVIVFYLKVSDEEAAARMIKRNQQLLLEGKPIRSDTDTAEKVQTKLDFFHKDVMPAINYLMAQQEGHYLNVYTIDQDIYRTPEDVHNRVVKLLVENYS